MNILCPTCKAMVRADDLNLPMLLAKCRPCQALFSFHNQVPEDDPLRRAAAPRKLDVPLPPKLTLKRAGSDVSIRWRWMTPASWVHLGLAIPWFGLLYFMISESYHGAPWLAAQLLTLPMLAVGIAGAYCGICRIVNRTVVGVSGRQLAVAHKPLPWPGNRVVPRGEVQQLYCRERFHGRRDRTATPVTYEVHLIGRTGSRLKLLGGLEELDQALFIEQELERALDIIDRRIEGEVRR